MLIFKKHFFFVKIGSDPFLKAVFKKELNADGRFSISAMENSPYVWQQRTKVTFDHFIQEFHALKNRSRYMFTSPYYVLEKFLEQVLFSLSLSVSLSLSLTLLVCVYMYIYMFI